MFTQNINNNILHIAANFYDRFQNGDINEINCIIGDVWENMSELSDADHTIRPCSVADLMLSAM